MVASKDLCRREKICYFVTNCGIIDLCCHFFGKLLYLGSPQDRIFRFCAGMWRSLVAHFVRDEGAAGSNPVIPILSLGVHSQINVAAAVSWNQFNDDEGCFTF